MKLTTKYSSIEKGVAVAYIVLLPLRMIRPVAGITAVFSAAANYFDFLLHIIGMLLLLLSNRGKIRTTALTSAFAKTVLFLLSTSFLTALLLYNTFGSLDGETSLDAILGPTIYYLQYIMIFLYNVNLFRMFTVKEIDRLMGVGVTWLGILGYAQILVVIGPEFVGRIYDGVNFLDALQSAEYLRDFGRIPLTGSEPASAGWMIGLYAFPYLLSKLISGERSNRVVLQLLAWLPITYFTKSTTCYFLVVSAFGVFLWLDRKRNKEKAINLGIIVLTVLAMVFFAIVLWGTPDDSSFMETVRYLLLEKATDDGNQSTVTRTIPTYINFRVFLKYPLFGVGNGNQGFFYREFFPAWGDVSEYIYDEIVGVADGGVFIPSLFSGFGIVGVIALGAYAVRHVKTAIAEKEELGSLYYMFIMAAVGFLINGFQGDYFGQYLPLFVMSIPFMGSCCQRPEGPNG